LADCESRLAKGCNRPIVTRSHEPGTKHSSLHPFSYQPEQLPGALEPVYRKTGKGE